MPSSSPFDVIVITSPDQTAATAVQQLILSSCGDFSNNDLSNSPTLHATDGTIFLSSCDPYGARLGSGGGTIAALAEAHEAYYNNRNSHVEKEDVQPPTVLICHAGGESSRCPTQITLGKAWTSLPSSCGTINNPTSLLISTLSSVFRDVPRGSVVVAASDVLLSFRGNNDRNGNDEGKKINFDNSKGVFGLAVPAPLSTAKNHGVFVLDNDNSISNSNDKGRWGLQSTFKVLQKPSVDDMVAMNNPSCVFDIATDNISDEDTRMAWIDTGVITFLPDAVETLMELSRKELKNCTRVGLLDSYNEKYNESSEAEMQVEEYAKSVAPKICLYGDMLHALQTTSSPSCDTTLFGALSKHELQTCVISEGSFVHLGTTGELIDFLVSGASTNSDDDDDDLQRKKIQSFAKSIGISSRSNAFSSVFKRDGGCDDTSLVILNSILVVDGCNSESCIGEGTVIEHCTIPFSAGAKDVESGKIMIGKRCLLSGIRGNLKGRDLCVPSEICLQILPLREGLGDFVCLCFGVNDGIKEATTLYGMDLYQVLDKSGLTESDLWDESIPSTRRMLWNAKINPILACADDEECPELNFSFLKWIQSLRDGIQPDATALVGLRQWKESKRIAICDIRRCVDSEAEAKYRSMISSVEVEQLHSITGCILDGKNKPCNFDYLFDICNVDTLKDLPATNRALKALDNVCYQAVEEEKFHILSRTFMVTSDLIATLHSNVDESESIEVKLPLTLCLKSIAQVIAIRDKMLNEAKYSSCCHLLESISSMATQQCISTDEAQSFIYTDPLPLETTAVASAPARIDLAGGWSDTPPISYEHGGAVACLAVLVAGKRPLRAKCRVVKGMTGIRLCTESRSLTDGETLLRSSGITINTVGDLKSFNDPGSECALLKCALVWLGLCPVEYIQDDKWKSHSIQPFLQKFCRREEKDDIGLELISTSLLPTGSGMGSSSILAGCIIASIAKCIGVVLEGMESDMEQSSSYRTITNGTNSLVHGVLMVEQLLTSGGGWQDQIGGLVGGLKLATSDRNILPLETKTTCYQLSEETINELNQRLILLDTGKPRLAKNILCNVLRRWAKRTSEIVETVHNLVSAASNAIQYTTKGDINSLGTCMSKYWDLKKTMAGESSGVEPENIDKLLQVLTSSKLIAGGTLCGAGGGGFLALIATGGESRTEIEAAMNIVGVDAEKFQWYSCTVATVGLLIDIR